MYKLHFRKRWLFMGCLYFNGTNVFRLFQLVEASYYPLCVSGAVNTQGFSWKFVSAIYTFSFIHSFIHPSIHLFVQSSLGDILYQGHIMRSVPLLVFAFIYICREDLLLL